MKKIICTITILFIGFIFHSVLASASDSPHFFGGIELNDSMLTAIEKIDTLADTSVSLGSAMVPWGLRHEVIHTVKNLKGTITTDIFLNLEDLAKKIHNAHCVRSFKMPSGNEKFLACAFEIDAKYVYINNIPFSVNMVFQAQPALYYINPKAYPRLNNGTILAYYLSQITLKEETKENEIKINNFDSVINLYKSSYNYNPNNYINTWVKPQTYDMKYLHSEPIWVYQQDDMSIAIYTSSHHEILYYRTDQDRSGLIKPQIEYEKYLKNETIEKYKNIPDHSNKI